MLIDVNIKGKLRVIVHYSKVLVLDYAFLLLLKGLLWVMGVQSILNMVSIEWINDAEGRRLDKSSDKLIFLSVVWQVMVMYIEGLLEMDLGGEAKMTIDWVRRLDKEIEE
jgi:hypothetical protein